MKKNKLFSILLLIAAVTFAACSTSTSDSNSGSSGGNGSGSGNTGTGNDNTDTSIPAQTFTVNYNDGCPNTEIAVPVDTTEYHYGDTVTVKFSDIGSRTGYTFAGWEGTVGNFTNNGTTTFTIEGDTGLTAKWEWAYSSKGTGTKAPNEEKSVGDIVFRDGSSMPYSFYTTLDADAKTGKKSLAIALVFYKGKDLNNGGDNSTSRTLGVGLKHGRCAWCTANAQAYHSIIPGIVCTPSGSAGNLNFTGVKDGRSNLTQIRDYLRAAEGKTNDTDTVENYPAFYFGNRSVYFSAGYLPSSAELFQIYKCREDTINGFDIDAASEDLGGDKFGNKEYLSASLRQSTNNYYMISFQHGSYDSCSQETEKNVCSIIQFN